MSKVNVGVTDGVFNVGLDLDEDGKNSMGLSVVLNEAVEEAFKREGAVAGVKLVDFSFSGMDLILKLDTDKDGENVLCLRLNLAEAFKEGASLVKKED